MFFQFHNNISYLFLGSFLLLTLKHIPINLDIFSLLYSEMSLKSIQIIETSLYG